MTDIKTLDLTDNESKILYRRLRQLYGEIENK
jgi:hypothetical protein